MVEDQAFLGNLVTSLIDVAMHGAAFSLILGTARLLSFWWLPGDEMPVPLEKENSIFVCRAPHRHRLRERVGWMLK